MYWGRAEAGVGEEDALEEERGGAGGGQRPTIVSFLRFAHYSLNSSLIGGLISLRV